MDQYTKIPTSDQTKPSLLKRQPSTQIDDLLAPEEGLSSSEAELRLLAYGPNEIIVPKPSSLRTFIHYFWGPMPALIWSATIIEIFRLGFLNVLFLLTLQLVNGLLWLYQEKSSNDAIESLKKSLAPKARVKRDGVWRIIEARNLTLGDKVLISAGDLLPADCKLGPGECLIDQSMITGETFPVLRKESSKVYMGSICKKGEIEAFVIHTGKNVFFCHTSLTTKVDTKGKMHKVFMKITLLLLIVSSVLVSVLLLLLLIKGNEFLESLAICVILMVISLPIAMKVVCATILSVGAKSLNRCNVIVSQLSALEDLAGLNVLCINKSGFLTKNEPRICDPILIDSDSIEELILVAYLACSKEKDLKSLDKSISDYATETLRLSVSHFEEEDFVPYDPKLKRTLATIRNTKTGEIFKCSKGSANVISKLTNNKDLEPSLTSHIQKLALEDKSALGVAISTKDHWIYCGIIPLHDPTLEDSAINLKTLKELQVKVLLTTGDQIGITKQICRNLNIGDTVFNAQILNKDISVIDREVLSSAVLYTDGFAEVYPEHKFTLVKMLQRLKQKVGVTGVSISDASALKRADVGIAGYGATDASMAAADIILYEPGLLPLIRALKQARQVFQKAETYSLYRIYCSFHLLFFLFICVVAINPREFRCDGVRHCSELPNTSIMPIISLVITTLLNNFLIISISYDSPKAALDPKRWNLALIFTISCALGLLSFFTSLGFLLLGLRHMDTSSPNALFHSLSISPLSYSEVLTGLFLKVSISNYLAIFTLRTKGLFFIDFPGKSLTFMTFSAIFLTMLICRYWFFNIEADSAYLSPIHWNLILSILLLDVIMLFIQDIAKIWLIRAAEVYYVEIKDPLMAKLVVTELEMKESLQA